MILTESEEDDRLRVSRSYDIRETMLPGPAQTSGYRTVVLVGPTGAGKTSLVRQLLGVVGAEDRFPAVSAAKTTVAETEVLLAPGGYYAVATFRSREEVRLLVAESLHAALVALADGRSEAEAERALLVHHEQRFHLRYLLGPAEGTGVVDLRGDRWIVEVLEGLRRLVEQHPGGAPARDRLWRAPAFSVVVDEVVEEVSARVGRVPSGTLRRAPDGWPVTWHHATDDRDELLDVLALFAGNDSRRYGRLVTPLVDGLRVRGPFRPLGVAEVPYLLVVDTEGLGHAPRGRGRLSPSLADSCRRADWVVLVDSAAQPMQAATTDALAELVAAGHADKLLLAFTHVDQLRGPNLRSAGARRDFLRSCRDQVVQHLVQTTRLDDPARRRLVRRLDEHTYFFGERGFSGERGFFGDGLPGAHAGVPGSADPQLGPLIRDLRAEAATSIPPVGALTCQRADVADALDDAVVAFRRAWLDEVRSVGGRSSNVEARAVSGGVAVGAAIGPGGRGEPNALDVRRPGRARRAIKRRRRPVAAASAAHQLTAGVVAGVSAVLPTERPRPADRFGRAATALVLDAAHRWIGELSSADWSGIAQLSTAEAEYRALARLLDRQLGLDWGQGFVAEAFAAVEQSLTEAGFVILDSDDPSTPGSRPLDDLDHHDFDLDGDDLDGGGLDGDGFDGDGLDGDGLDGDELGSCDGDLENRADADGVDVERSGGDRVASPGDGAPRAPAQRLARPQFEAVADVQVAVGSAKTVRG